MICTTNFLEIILEKLKCISTGKIFTLLKVSDIDYLFKKQGINFIYK